MPRPVPSKPGKKRSIRNLLAIELVADVEGPWTIESTVLDASAVNKTERIARVPPAYTAAQQLARLHELTHGRMSPTNWKKIRTQILSRGDDAGLNLDSDAILKISKMLEENRIDSWLWTSRAIDMRPAREALNWAAMPIPDDNILEATCQVLQLAWTVWGSKGTFEGEIEGLPEPRELSPAVAEYFDSAWQQVVRFNKDLAFAVMKTCVLMYTDSSDETRDDAAYEIAQYFPKVEEYEQPEPTPEESAAQEKAEAEADEQDAAQDEDESGGDHNGVETHGHWQLHDHTVGRRRPMVKIRKRYTAVDQGVIFRYPHRYVLDRMIFGRRIRQTGSLMIDMSGSMEWTNEDILFLLDHMPQLWIGGYSGHTIPSQPQVMGRICILAKNGRFNEFTGLESTSNKGNDIDVEALAYLSKMPEPRFWLSDGGVVGGVYQDQLHPQYPIGWGYQSYGRIIYEVNLLMKRNGILRIDTKEDMVKLFKRQRVVLYKSTILSDDHIAALSASVGSTTPYTRSQFYPPELPCQPLSFQL